MFFYRYYKLSLFQMLRRNKQNSNNIFKKENYKGTKNERSNSKIKGS